ncbi:hypothetical protein AVEN_82670-1 [Araneus ventricosus]|uniref:Uncharacterized protein n=1 Tax=Araneus ventricosus TaxID=182803 RepID=A0A4Y2P5L3_ARAVE|nr:hypothetical protein AVEN_82670-1 [Araneus ventricosus]
MDNLLMKKLTGAVEEKSCIRDQKPYDTIIQLFSQGINEPIVHVGANGISNRRRHGKIHVCRVASRKLGLPTDQTISWRAFLKGSSPSAIIAALKGER